MIPFLGAGASKHITKHRPYGSRSRLRREAMTGGLLLLGTAVLIVLSTSASSRAFVPWFGRCNGSDVKWRGDFDLHRNSFSIPNSGDVNTAYFNGVGQWNKYSNLLSSSDFFVNPTSDTRWDRATNAENEVSRADRSAIDGLDGVTFPDIGGCGIGANDIDEMDIVIANDMAMAPGVGNDPIGTGGNDGRTTFVHEFGHFFGFGHSAQPWTQMISAGMGTLTGGNEAAATFPDDTIGMKTFYGMTGTSANLMTSATRITNGFVVNLDPTQLINACRNSSQSVTFYIGKAADRNYSINFGDEFHSSTPRGSRACGSRGSSSGRV